MRSRHAAGGRRRGAADRARPRRRGLGRPATVARALSEPASQTSPAVIEFGGLEDDPDEEGQPPAETDADHRLLRISPHTAASNETEPGDSGPVTEIGLLQQMLAEVEEEFQPAGSIGPEVDLALDDPAHPFRETFAEEEVVADRYAATKNKPPRAPPNADAVPQETLAACATACRKQCHHETPQTESCSCAAWPEKPLPAESLLDPARLCAPASPQQRHAEPPPAAVASAPWPTQPEGALLDEDEAMAAAENNPTTPRQACAIVDLPRQQYGRLFARLRRSLLRTETWA